MKIVGCDLHARQQSIAVLDTGRQVAYSVTRSLQRRTTVEIRHSRMGFPRSATTFRGDRTLRNLGWIQISGKS
jgi:hypothetical protein